jgi:hypothetical protein
LRTSNPQPSKPEVAGDFVTRSSPWVDFSLTSFYLENRAGNFLNLGVQFGGYVLERFRFSARIVAPLSEVTDDLSSSPLLVGSSTGSGSYQRVNSRSMALLYGVSAGLMISNSKSFVFGPSVELQRTDVEDYGSAVLLGLPFEWTTAKSLRVGFEIAYGHAFGGSYKEVCQTSTGPATSCASRRVDRAGGNAVVFHYTMGWSLGAL